MLERMDEVALRGLIASMPQIEQAKGMLMAYYGLDAEQAFGVLRRWSSVRQLKLRDVAALLVEHAVSTPPSRAESEGGDRGMGEWRPFDVIRSVVTRQGLA